MSSSVTTQTSGNLNHTVVKNSKLVSAFFNADDYTERRSNVTRICVSGMFVFQAVL
jgi:hypothetical protein